MATVTKKECDVFETTKNVDVINVHVSKQTEDGVETPVTTHNGDLGPRALLRLLKKIQDGMSPPTTRRKREEVDTEEKAEPGTVDITKA